MSTFVCPHCGDPTDLFGHGGAQAAAARIRGAIPGRVPLHLRIREGGDSGRPIVATEPDFSQADAFMNIARNIAAQVSVVAYRQQTKARARPSPSSASARRAMVGA